MNKELQKTKQNLLTEQNYLRKENARLEVVIDSQMQREKNEQRIKEIEEELLAVHIQIIKNSDSCLKCQQKQENSEEVKGDEKNF